MGRKQRRRHREGQGQATPAAMRRPRRQIIPWRERAREVLGRLREQARERAGDEIEAYMRQRFGDAAADVGVHDLQQAFDDYLCAPGSAGQGSAGEGRSLVRAFAEEADDLQAEERSQLPTWETDRRRRVYLLDCCFRDRLDLWDPIAGGRAVLHLIEKMPPARVAALRRGTVVIATSAPFGQRRIILGQMEIYEGEDALTMCRDEVRGEGRIWHDLPPAAPST